MIYTDPQSQFDTDSFPAYRKGKCIYCRNEWQFHNGWACDSGIPNRFSEVNPKRRFLVDEMTIYNMNQLTFDDIPDTKRDVKEYWREWAHNVPGDCPCGIKKEQCQFHKGR